MKDVAKEAHEQLVELVAEGNDALMEEFFEKGTIPEEDLVPRASQRHPRRQIFPVLFAFRPWQHGRRPS